MKRVVTMTAGAVLMGSMALGTQAVAFGAMAHKTPVKHVSMVEPTPNEFAFQPKKITIKVGTKVTWKNTSSQPHTVTDKATNKYFDSGSDPNKLVSPGKSWSFVFKKPGTYHYYCVIHPTMVGTVIVKK
jgi:plastocyanin